jgi:peptidyl-prolyl cis-trans isomerase SurA
MPGRALLPLLLAALLGGCSVPSWVPFFGKDKPAPPGAPAQEPGLKAAPILSRPLPDSDGVLDRVIGVVNNDAITLYELDELEAEYLARNRERPPSGEARRELRERLLRTLIENRIQLQQAERERITVEDAEIKERMDEIMKNLSMTSEKEFEALLKSQGLTLEGVKKRVREELMVQRLIRRKVAFRVSVTEQEIDRYLAENREKLETGLTFEARHILFLPEQGKGEEGWEAARRKAEQVYAMLLEGQDFAELARKYSEDGSGKEGGSLGRLKRGELTPEIEKAILSLQPGESSPPFRSHVGYHIFHLDSRESLSGPALAQARSQIREILYRQKYEARLKEYLAELKQRAIIDVRM